MRTPGRGERRLLSVVTARTAAARAATTCSTKTSFSRRTASARCRGFTRTIRIVLRRRRPRTSRRLRARRVDDGTLWRQLQLARADLVSGELSADRVAAEVPSLLRRRLQGGVPDRFGADDDALGSRRRSCRAGCRASSCATRTGGGRCSATSSAFQHDPHWRDLVPFHEYFHGDTGAASAPAIRPDGPDWSPSSCSRAATDVRQALALRCQSSCAYPKRATERKRCSKAATTPDRTRSARRRRSRSSR